MKKQRPLPSASINSSLGSGGICSIKGARYDPSRGVIALRFDDSDDANIDVVYPELVSRGLIAGFSLVLSGANGIDAAGQITLAEAKTLQAAGNEILCHSRTHAADPATFDAFLDQTVRAGQDMRNQGLNVYSFVQPGTWIGAANTYNLTTTAFWGTAGDLALRAFYSSYEAYIGTAAAWFDSSTLPCSGVNRYGAANFAGDIATLASLKSVVDWAIMHGTGHEILIHPVLIGGAGLTLANFRTFLDYLVTWRTAGLLDILTPTQMTTGLPVTGTWTRYTGTLATDVDDTRMDSKNADSTASAMNNYWATRFAADRVFRSLMRFTTLSTLAGKTLRNIYLCIIPSQATAAAMAATAYRILPANTGWTKAGASWNHSVGATHWVGASGCDTAGTDRSATALATLPGGSIVSKAPYLRAVDPTEFGLMIANNAGIVLFADDEVTISTVNNWASSGATDATRIPYLIAQYHD